MLVRSFPFLVAGHPSSARNLSQKRDRILPFEARAIADRDHSLILQSNEFVTETEPREVN